MCEWCKVLQERSKIVPPIYYEDELIIVFWYRDYLRAVYKYHEEPKPKDDEWLKTRLDVTGKKIFGREWVMESSPTFGHRYYTALPRPRRVKKRDKKFEQQEYRPIS